MKYLLLPNFLSEVKSIAVVGASNNPDKYGHKVTADLLSAGFDVYPVNLKEKLILGLPVAASVGEIEAKIDLAVLVIPPAATLPVLEECLKEKVSKVWFQPGSEGEEEVQFCEQNGIYHFEKACIMIERLNYKKGGQDAA